MWAVQSSGTVVVRLNRARDCITPLQLHTPLFIYIGPVGSVNESCFQGRVPYYCQQNSTVQLNANARTQCSVFTKAVAVSRPIHRQLL